MCPISRSVVALFHPKRFMYTKLVWLSEYEGMYDVRLCRRYHEMFSNKYGQSAPGKMSSELRHALGLHTHQISETVYRMRLLGYPPGWLMEAREQTGEVLLIGGDGKGKARSPLSEISSHLQFSPSVTYSLFISLGNTFTCIEDTFYCIK